MEFSSCCKNISAMVLEMGEPMAIPLSGWYIWPWKEEQFCLRMVFSSVMSWWVVFWLLCALRWAWVMSRVSCMGMLTYRSLMSNMRSLWWLLIFRFTNSFARVLELTVLKWFPRCRCMLKMVFSRLAVLCAGALVLFTTGLMGLLGLWSFRRALIVGGDGFFWVRNLICFLSMILSHCCSVLRIVLWSWL